MYPVPQLKTAKARPIKARLIQERMRRFVLQEAMSINLGIGHLISIEAITVFSLIAQRSVWQRQLFLWFISKRVEIQSLKQMS